MPPKSNSLALTLSRVSSSHHDLTHLGEDPFDTEEMLVSSRIELASDDVELLRNEDTLGRRSRNPILTLNQ